MALSRCVRSAIFGIMLFLSSLFGVIVLGGWVMPLFFISPKLYRHHFDRMIGAWEYLCVALLEYLFGMRVTITGDRIRHGERALIMMNHRTRLDWLYFWSVLVRQSSVKTEKIILKSPLKRIPGAGWAMQVGAFIFIDRSWEKDKKILDKMMTYFSDLDHKTQVLIFPEGTDFTERNKNRSDEFARRNGWDLYDYCLHPRTTGFTYLTQLMRQNNQIDAVYDVSIAYPLNFPQTEPELLTGNVPEEVHFHIQRHAIHTLPNDDQGLQSWCQERWKAKEKLLAQFHIDKKFPSNCTASEVESEEDKVAPKGHIFKPEVLLVLALVYWTLFVIGISMILYYSWLARWLAVAQVIFYIYMGHRYGGFEHFQADYFNWFFNKKKKHT